MYVNVNIMFDIAFRLVIPIQQQRNRKRQQTNNQETTSNLNKTIFVREFVRMCFHWKRIYIQSKIKTLFVINYMTTSYT